MYYFYPVDYNLSYLFDALNCPRFVQWEMLGALSCVLLTDPCIFFFFALLCLLHYKKPSLQGLFYTFPLGFYLIFSVRTHSKCFQSFEKCRGLVYYQQMVNFIKSPINTLKEFVFCHFGEQSPLYELV